MMGKLKGIAMFVIFVIVSSVIAYRVSEMAMTQVSTSIRQSREFQNREISKLKIQQGKVISFNKFSKGVSQSRTGEPYWSITYIDSDGNTGSIEIIDTDLKIHPNTSQDANYITFKYLDNDIVNPENKNMSVFKGYYEVNMYVK